MHRKNTSVGSVIIHMALLSILMFYANQADGAPPSDPRNVHMDPDYDTMGVSNSDGVTYEGRPWFEWLSPLYPNGTITNYQWSVTTRYNNLFSPKVR